MKVCFTWLAIIGLAVWNVGCGSADSDTDPMSGTDLGAPGGIELGSQTPGMDEDTSTDDTSSEDTSTGETGADEAETDGPELPETTDE